MDHNQIGNKSEMIAATDILSTADISFPFGELSYDLVADFDNQLYRIQVKTAQRTGQRNNAHSVHVTHGIGGKTYTVNEFDILAVVEKDSEKVAYWPWTDESLRETLTVWFDRSPEDFRNCNKSMANISEEMTFEFAIESLK